VARCEGAAASGHPLTDEYRDPGGAVFGAPHALDKVERTRDRVSPSVARR
jgi:hypothetical protein